MSERTDRRIQGNQLVWGAGLLLLVLAAGAGFYFWSGMKDADLPRNPEERGHPASAPRVGIDEPLMVTLFHPVDGMLTPGSAAVKRRPDTQSQAREAILALFADQRAASAAGLGEVKLRALYLDASGAAYVDLAILPQKDVKASAWEEHLTVYAVVNTLTQNFDEIKQVRFLLNGKEAQTLAGHVDLSRTFTKRTDLVRQ